MPPRKKPIAPAVHPFDRAHGTDTSGLIPGPAIAEGTTHKVEDLTAYYGIAPSILTGLTDLWLQQLHPQSPIEQTVFLDVGAGKGRAMMLASQLPFRRIEGIELSPAMYAIAQRNLAIWGADPTAEALAPIMLHHADATTHPLPHAPTLAFLFHPFEAKLLNRFLRHVESEQAESPQPFDLIYANAEHDSLLDRDPCFRRIWLGRVPMSTDDHLADLAEIAQQTEYGSTGDELCAIYRFHPRGQ
ncbi:class I SAM-dependent methyltransferase [Granulicella cerasi]|uniref:Class I SAM-dependent methyltransferase n=1 Tax=Granulicella cerasi TaxID=741063 RepID=A0ABW1ZD57_9BACT|nr:class I SAM-dependent methyltransferase [Granulicella cerasi]